MRGNRYPWFVWSCLLCVIASMVVWSAIFWREFSQSAEMSIHFWGYTKCWTVPGMAAFAIFPGTGIALAYLAIAQSKIRIDAKIEQPFDRLFFAVTALAPAWAMLVWSTSINGLGYYSQRTIDITPPVMACFFVAAGLGCLVAAVTKWQRLSPSDLTAEPEEDPPSGMAQLPYKEFGETGRAFDYAVLVIAWPMLLVSFLFIDLLRQGDIEHLVVPFIMPAVLLFGLLASSELQWTISCSDIAVISRRGLSSSVRLIRYSQLESVEVVKFSGADFEDNIGAPGKSKRFRGVTAYYGAHAKKGVILRMKDGDSCLIGFHRPDEAAAVITQLAGLEHGES